MARRGLLGLAAAAPLLASTALILYLTNVDVAQSAKLELWSRLLQLLLAACVVYLADIAANRRLSAGAKLLWASGILALWPLAMPTYLLARVVRLASPRPGDATLTRGTAGSPVCRAERAVTEGEKVRAAVDLLVAKGLSRRRIAPPLYRLAWQLGRHLPPPYFLTAPAIVRIQGLGFGTVFALIMWILLLGLVARGWMPGVVLAAIYFIVVPLLGSFFGLVSALIAALEGHRQRRQLGLPLWRDYSP